MELHPYQRTLLDLIWAGVEHPEYNDDRPTWRVWDYVGRLLEQRHPDVDDALDVWESLPVQYVPLGGGRSMPYGLVWSTNTGGLPPQRDSRVGLTIAGLRALAATSASAGRYANHFADVIGSIAHSDDQLEPTAEAAVEALVPLEAFTEAIRTPTVEDALAVPDDITLLVLQHEPPQIEVYGTFTEVPAHIQLGARRLRRYRRVQTAADYLNVIDQLVGQQTGSRPMTALSLLQAFDYLGYVLKDHPEWTTRRLTLAPDLESAAALGRDVTTSDEYNSALSGLSTILDQLQVREIPEDDPLVRTDPNYGAGSINRFHYWMNIYVSPVVGDDAIDEAIQALRDVKKLRTEAQHGSAKNRAAAAAARSRFGLPAFTSDYAHQWNLVRRGVANALDLIRVEVQAAQRSTVE